MKHGHPECLQCVGYNYSNECMELLHNLIHDWPKDTAPILHAGMLVNNTGKPGKFKETDIRVEQLNKKVKSHTSGANARPGVLKKITPALGHVHELIEQLSEELGVEADNQHHAEVRQHKDVQLLLNVLCAAKIFDFSADRKHGNDSLHPLTQPQDVRDERELNKAQDTDPVEFTIDEPDEDFYEMVQNDT
ncbi:hypothetical protein L208DRAFT_1378252 [Tricholoma matsutake]|nr:hypothetical protein L208DRAFT_1378252 [Tricholoma matsutake 945]